MKLVDNAENDEDPKVLYGEYGQEKTSSMRRHESTDHIEHPKIPKIMNRISSAQDGISYPQQIGEDNLV